MVLKGLILDNLCQLGSCSGPERTDVVIFFSLGWV